MSFFACFLKFCAQRVVLPVPVRMRSDTRLQLRKSLQVRNILVIFEYVSPTPVAIALSKIIRPKPSLLPSFFFPFCFRIFSLILSFFFFLVTRVCCTFFLSRVVNQRNRFFIDSAAIFWVLEHELRDRDLVAAVTEFPR